MSFFAYRVKSSGVSSLGNRLTWFNLYVLMTCGALVMRHVVVWRKPLSNDIPGTRHAVGVFAPANLEHCGTEQARHGTSSRNKLLEYRRKQKLRQLHGSHLRETVILFRNPESKLSPKTLRAFSTYR